MRVANPRMTGRARLAPTSASLALATAIVLLPNPGHRVERNTELDIRKLQETDCEYRGITASFEEVSRAYALRTYEGSRLVRWEARPHSRNPDSETLVTAVFAASGQRAAAGPPPPPLVAEARRQASPSFHVTWCLRFLGDTRIGPHNIYARDAVAVFRQTVQDFVDRMIVVSAPAALRAGPGPAHVQIETLQAGAVLLRQESEEDQEHWSYVRIPETQTTGWIEKEYLIAISETR